jgi:hypothetical protein
MWEFIKIGFVFKFFVGMCDLRELCVSIMVIHLAGGSAAQFPHNFVGSEHIACLLLIARSAFGGLSQ